jgi:protein SCO1/2
MCIASPAFFSRKCRYALFAAGLVLLAAVLLWSGRGASADEAGFYLHFRELSLLDQRSQPVSPARLAGQTVLVNFVFTGCSVACPLQTRALVCLRERMPSELRERVQFLSVSLDPFHDTPETLRSFAEQMGADLPGWTFATGRPEEVARLAETLRLFRPGGDRTKLDDHSTALWLVDREGELRMRYAGAPTDVDRLLADITALDRLGTPR